jgi:hypothetical protein
MGCWVGPTAGVEILEQINISFGFKKMVTLSLSAPWRNIRLTEVQLHSLLTLE